MIPGKVLIPPIIFLSLILILGALPGCRENNPTVPPDDPTPEYAGSTACAGCHPEQYGRWAESGHPLQMVRVQGQSPVDSFPSFSAFGSDPVIPPSGYSWQDISFVVGGYGWKMNWLDGEGFLITQNLDSQYNFQDQTEVAYAADDPPGTRKYDCGGCHTTGWEDSDDGDPTNNQEGLVGLVGNFFASGVHCEACHGPGNAHSLSPEDSPLVVDHSSEGCADCHRRSEDDAILAAGGFIQNGQQYSEWLHSPHSAPGAPGCNDCHDPHSSVKHDQAAAGTGTLTTCEGCHPGFVGGANHPPSASCIDCHMPYAARSAITVAASVGDVRTHIINTTAGADQDSMFNSAGDRLRLNEAGQAVIAIEFVCMVCHSPTRSAGRSQGKIYSLTEIQAILAAGPVHR